MRQPPQELEFETDPATLRKLILISVAGLTILSGGIGGVFYVASQAKSMPAASASEPAMVPTSINGWQAQLLSGGKIKAGEFDQLRRDACAAIEAVNAGMPQGRRQPTCEQMQEIMRDPASFAKAARAMQERMRYH